jgi:hypothetical protein
LFFGGFGTLDFYESFFLSIKCTMGLENYTGISPAVLRLGSAKTEEFQADVSGTSWV